MADSKISDLTELTSPADPDEVAIVDKSDTTQASTGSTKRITRSNFLGTNLSAFEDITIKDEDDMASDSATAVPTQQSVKAYVDTYGFSGATFNAPQGFLLNGKIVPSVSSNNLTVALKTLAGTDPSASAPVYIRIGDTVRSVTSALSVTKNAGTNWMNAGSSELATKEIDYFVYLGYNATDGVTIGFSRIPYGTQYGDFSATTTNEKYCAISTITNASSTDYYENVGRFAATLSAGAGYTWSVPTFTAENLIQRPIYETRILSWVPQYTGFSSNPTVEFAKYQIINNRLKANLKEYSNGTSNSTSKSVSFPFSSSGYSVAFSWINTIDNGSQGIGKMAFWSSTKTPTLYPNLTSGSWTSSGSCRIDSAGSNIEYVI